MQWLLHGVVPGDPFTQLSCGCRTSCLRVTCCVRLQASNAQQQQKFIPKVLLEGQVTPGASGLPEGQVTPDPKVLLEGRVIPGPKGILEGRVNTGPEVLRKGQATPGTFLSDVDNLRMDLDRI